MLSDWEAVLEIGKTEALSSIFSRYEQNDELYSYLPFHNRMHTEDVTGLVSKLVRSITCVVPGSISPKEEALIKFAALYHDLVQEWEVEKCQVGNVEVVKRIRLRGSNEKKSALALQDLLTKLHNESGNKLFTKSDFDSVMESILITVPGFSVELNTVIQPNFTNNSSLPARLLGLADLGRPGSLPERFIDEGYRLFREDNLDMITIADWYKSIPSADREVYRERMITWGEFQVNFVAMRMRFLNDEIAGLPPLVQRAIREVLCRYEDALALAKGELGRAAKAGFEELLEQFGYGGRTSN